MELVDIVASLYALARRQDITRMKLLSAVKGAQSAVSNLIAAIEGHHATNTCRSEGLLSEAKRHYKQLDIIREAICEANEASCGNPTEDVRKGNGNER